MGDLRGSASGAQSNLYARHRRLQFSLRGLMACVGLAALVVAYAMELPRIGRVLLVTLGPLSLMLAIAAFFVRNPKHLAAWFFAIHTVIAGGVVYLANLGTGAGDLVTSLLLYCCDFPLAPFYMYLFDDNVDQVVRTIPGAIGTLIVGGLPWAGLGWLIARNRRKEARVRNEMAWRVAALTFVLHAALATAIIMWSSIADDATAKAGRLYVLWLLDFPVSLFMFFLVGYWPSSIAGVSTQHAIIIIGLGSMAWAVLAWLIIRAWPVRTLEGPIGRPIFPPPRWPRLPV